MNVSDLGRLNKAISNEEAQSQLSTLTVQVSLYNKYRMANIIISIKYIMLDAIQHEIVNVSSEINMIPQAKVNICEN